MEREALAALEKRVEALRLLTAEKSVAARAMSAGPIAHHEELATALLALVVFIVFLVGGGLGTITNDACPAIGSGQFATVRVATETWSVTLDTNGNMDRTGSIELHHPETVHRHISPEVVRTIANRLARGCFLEHQPPKTGIADGSALILTLRAGDRVATYDDKWPSRSFGSMRLCNGVDTLGGVADDVMALARVREELFNHD